MKSNARIAALVALAAVLTVAPVAQAADGHATAKPATKKVQTKPAAKKVLYVCPMHPNVKSDKPGKCPDCGMFLEKKAK